MGRPKGTTGIKRKDREITATPLEMSRTVGFLNELRKLPRIDVNDLDALAERTDYYFNECMLQGFKPTVEALCLSVGISTVIFKQWGSGDRRGSNPAYKAYVEAVRSMMSSVLAQMMADGKVNPVYGIFMFKNHFNYRDQTEVAVTTPNPLGEAESAESLQKKYLEKSGAIELEAKEID